MFVSLFYQSELLEEMYEQRKTSHTLKESILPATFLNSVFYQMFRNESLTILVNLEIYIMCGLMQYCILHYLLEYVL